MRIYIHRPVFGMLAHHSFKIRMLLIVKLSEKLTKWTMVVMIQIRRKNWYFKTPLKWTFFISKRYNQCYFNILTTGSSNTVEIIIMDHNQGIAPISTEEYFSNILSCSALFIHYVHCVWNSPRCSSMYSTNVFWILQSNCLEIASERNSCGTLRWWWKYISLPMSLM